MIMCFIKIKEVNMLVKCFVFFVSVFYFALCNAEQHIYENNNDFTVSCTKNEVCKLIYNEKAYVVLPFINYEPSNIYFENEVYNITYPCGTSCVKYIYFKRPNIVSEPYLNSLAMSANGEFVLTVYENLAQVYETFTHKKVYEKKLNNGGDILSNGSFDDARYDQGSFFIRYKTDKGDFLDEKITME
jgi:hypothetical protein